jgi:hypothetical protein
MANSLNNKLDLGAIQRVGKDRKDTKGFETTKKFLMNAAKGG